MQTSIQKKDFFLTMKKLNKIKNIILGSFSHSIEIVYTTSLETLDDKLWILCYGCLSSDLWELWVQSSQDKSRIPHEWHFVHRLMCLFIMQKQVHSPYDSSYVVLKRKPKCSASMVAKLGSPQAIPLRHYFLSLPSYGLIARDSIM